MPEILMPFAPAVSPHAAALDEHARSWIKNRWSADHPQRWDRWARSCFGSFAALTCPGAELPALTLYTDWLTFGFVYDDVFFDESDHPATAASIAEAVIAAVSCFEPIGIPLDLPHVATRDSSHYLDILTNLIRRTEQTARPEQFHRLCAQMTTWFYSYLYEPALDTGGTAMPLDGYAANRLHNIATAPYVTLAEIAAECPITGDQHADPALRRLSALAAHEMAWCNDIFSAKREAAVNDSIENLITCLTREGRTIAQALDYATSVHNNTMNAYLTLEAQILPQAGAAVRSYLDVLRAWMRGHYDWCTTTARFKTEIA